MSATKMSTPTGALIWNEQLVPLLTAVQLAFGFDAEGGVRLNGPCVAAAEVGAAPLLLKSVRVIEPVFEGMYFGVRWFEAVDDPFGMRTVSDTVEMPDPVNVGLGVLVGLAPEPPVEGATEPPPPPPPPQEARSEATRTRTRPRSVIRMVAAP